MRCFYLILIILFSVLPPLICKRLTHSFHIQRLQVDLPIQNNGNGACRLSMDEIRKILSQKFFYLNRGSQAFVFVSEDKSVVLKLFLFDIQDRLISRIFKTSTLNYQDQQIRHAQKTMDACQTAFLHAPNETGLIYIHLNLDEEPLLVDLRGPAWHRMKLDLRNVRFVLQHRADSFEKNLLEAVRANHHDEFMRLIERFQHFLHRRIAAGIRNTDPTLFDNFGWFNQEPIEIDFGHYVYSRDFICEKNETKKYTQSLMKWVDQNAPFWSDDVVRCLDRDE